MATTAWSQSNKSTTDAEFRAWGKTISDNLALLSTKLVKTSDTGQVNWTTVTLPAASSMGGYEIYYLNDAMHSTAPVYFKIEYRTGSDAGDPYVRVVAGTGTDGAGNLTGILATGGTSFPASVGNAGGTTAYSCYACATEGSFWFMLWVTDATNGFFGCHRSVDSNGDPDADGLYLHSHGENNGLTNNRYNGTHYRYSDSTIVNQIAAGDEVLVVHGGHGLSSTEAVDENGNYPAYLAFLETPRLRPLNTMCGVHSSHVGASGTTFSTTLVGATSHTYIMPHTFVNHTNGTLYLALIWE